MKITTIVMTMSRFLFLFVRRFFEFFNHFFEFLFGYAGQFVYFIDVHLFEHLFDNT